MKEITDEEIKYILSNHKKLLRQIQMRIRELYKDMDTTSELIRSASMGNSSGERTGGSSYTSQDLSDVLSRYRKMIEEQEIEIRAGLIRLTEEQEKINRVWVCYRALPHEEHLLIMELYVNKKLYKTVEKESGMNHRQFEKFRKRALERIKTLYMSSCSNLQIISYKPSKYEQLRLALE